MEVPSMLRGESLKRLLQGVVLGVALTVVIGFNWLHYGFGWTLGGTAETMASHRVDVALVAAYTPVCVEKFVGPAEPNSSVALSCAGVLTKLLEARAPKK